jgi:hypothetical protein
MFSKGIVKKRKTRRRTMARTNRITLVLLTVWIAVSAASARAEMLNMPIFPPIGYAVQVDMKYTIFSATLGKFTASGNLQSIKGVNGITVPTPGSFLLTAFFNRSTGQIILDDVNPAFDPLLDVKDSGANQLFLGHRLNRFAADLTVLSPAFDFEFFNDPGSGSQPLLNPKEFIGVNLRNVTSFAGTKSFIDTTNAVNFVVFNNNLMSGMEAGTANVFMTPTPTAIAGGAFLLCCIFFAEKHRRHSSSCRFE